MGSAIKGNADIVEESVYCSSPHLLPHAFNASHLMMDQAAVNGLTGFIAGILDILERSLTTLSRIITRYRDAVLYMTLVASQLPRLMSTLTQLLEWIQFSPAGLDGNSILLGDLRRSKIACELLAWTLDTGIQKIHGSDESNPKLYHKLLLAFDTTCNERQMQITHQVTALHFLLSAINW